MTRTVADRAAELQAIAGRDPEDPATGGQPPVPDYLEALDEQRLAIVNNTIDGTAYSEATLLALGYAYEQAAKLRRPPSEINPSMWRCVPGSAFAPRSCAP